jgi:prepilin-type N-terminal cleavage/methylation domain-containing protein
MRRSHLWAVLRSESGFTLIELLAVTVVLVILALMALPVYAEVTDKARTAKVTENLRIIEQALESYRADPGHNRYPATLDDLIEGGFLKPGAETPWSIFQSPWSDSKDIVYYYYAVDDPSSRTGFLLIGPDSKSTCSGSRRTVEFCNKPNDPAWENSSLEIPLGLKLDPDHYEQDRARIRKSR